MSKPAQEIDLAALNSSFETSHPSEVVRWAIEQWGDEVVTSSSFGAESAVMIHLAIEHNPRIRVIMVDTGFLFPETWQHMESLRKRFDLNVWVYRTRTDPSAWLKSVGENDPTTRCDVDRCCAINKNEPFDRAMKELAPKAWLRGIRRNQADTRKAVDFVEWNARYNCHAVSPILNWGSREIHQYMKEHGLPYHPLYDKGYFSIGCNPLSCTRPVLPGEDPRSGRWAGQAKVECGLHLGGQEKNAKHKA